MKAMTASEQAEHRDTCKIVRSIVSALNLISARDAEDECAWVK